MSVDNYVADHCPTYEYAYEVAAMIRHEFPTVHLRLLDIDDPKIIIPESVFATPTYLLNGNPSPQEVHQALSAWYDC